MNKLDYISLGDIARARNLVKEITNIRYDFIDDIEDKKRLMKIDEIKAALDDLTDEERLDIFHNYCIGCGSKNTNCQCWNDE